MSTRRQFLEQVAATGALVATSVQAAEEAGAGTNRAISVNKVERSARIKSVTRRLDGLQLFSGGYPQAVFFRVSEDLARGNRLTYADWEKTFMPLAGVIAKALDEERPAPNDAIVEYCSRFKRQHPEKLVLLHYNNGGRDPIDGGERFFAGHWIYYNGSHITSDVPAEAGETELSVEHPELFRLDVGEGDSSDDVGLCALGVDGTPDWRFSEQVKLLAIDLNRKTIRVRRGCYQTKPRAFQAGFTYAAAHATEGPYDKPDTPGGGDIHVMRNPRLRPYNDPKCHLMWAYNFSTRCPRDAQGRRCADVLANDLATQFLPGGRLQLFDGIEFDVGQERFDTTLAALFSMKGGRQGDLDADGRGDNGIFDGVNDYRIGLYHFYELLRQHLGNDRLIMADCQPRGRGGLSWQQCYGVLNGVEEEGFGSCTAKSVARDWSEGMNLFRAWHQFGSAPVYSYINHKEFEAEWDNVPFHFHRYVLASVVICDAGFTQFQSVTPEPGELYGTLDELLKGTEREYGWLGRPVGDGVHLACRTTNLLAENGTGAGLLPRISPFDGTQATVENGEVRLAASAMKDAAVNQPTPWPESPWLMGNDGYLGFTLRDVPIAAEGSDLVVMVRYRAEPLSKAPQNRPRETGILVSSPRTPSAAQRIGAMVYQKPFEAGFFFSSVPGDAKNLEFIVRGTAPVWIESIRVFAHPDVMCREFEKGLVLLNPSDHPYTFDLAHLAPGKHYRRLRGSAHQDPAVNNGTPVEGPVTLEPKDGLFLVKTARRRR